MTAPLSARTDAYLHGATRENAALALAAHNEATDSDALLRTMQGLNGSPMYALAEEELLYYLHAIQREKPRNAREQRSFFLRLFAARCIHAGLKHAEVRS